MFVNEKYTLIKRIVKKKLRLPKRFKNTLVFRKKSSWQRQPTSSYNHIQTLMLSNAPVTQGHVPTTLIKTPLRS